MPNESESIGHKMVKIATIYITSSRLIYTEKLR